MEYKLLLAGIVCMGIEFIIPGFGIFGVLGLIALSLGVFFLLGGGLQAIVILAAVYAAVIAAIAFLCFYLPKESKWNPFVLWDKQKNSAGYTGSSDASDYLGKTAVTVTPLRPAGTVLLDGVRLDVSSLGDYIDKGARVRIVKTEGAKIFVQQIIDEE